MKLRLIEQDVRLVEAVHRIAFSRRASESLSQVADPLLPHCTLRRFEENESSRCAANGERMAFRSQVEPECRIVRYPLSQAITAGWQVFLAIITQPIASRCPLIG